MGESSIETLREFVPGLRGGVELDGVGHWPQREAPEVTSQALIDFLRSL